MTNELTEHQKRNKEIYEAKSKENFDYIEGERATKSEVVEVQRVIFPKGDCRVTKLLNGEVVTGFLHEDGVFTHAQPIKNDYDIPTEDKVGVELKFRDKWYEKDRSKVIYIEDTQEEPKEVDSRFYVYKKVLDSSDKYYKVGHLTHSNGWIRLSFPRFRDKDSTNKEKYSTNWYRDSNPLEPEKNIMVEFVPTNDDIPEIVNSNKNESIGYVSCEGNVIYWNQYRY